MTSYYFQCGGCGVHVQHLPRCTFTHAEFSESPPPEREHMREMQAEIERLRADVQALAQLLADVGVRTEVIQSHLSEADDAS